ncbi:dihydrofolate reductase family protein [Nocardia crassostreae]|uniref:dihydrofolate reductase family protein n=1 Tax=Nocardia crassostreae TaxID=53428 RepID=UPI000831AF5E|nr:dihydrofolate reductase family protein [Nocardia crassostreae]
MSKVIANATMSLDGNIAGPGETGFEHLFAWYSTGDVDYPSANPDVPFRMTADDAAYLRALVDSSGVLVVGRRLFDITNGWNGIHPLDKPIVVVTHRIPEQWIAEHPDAPFTFATGGIKEAIDTARQIAGDKTIAVNGGAMARQCLEAGLLDELLIDLAPVLLGDGVPMFGHFDNAPVLLDGPEIVPGNRVTHLHYRFT